MTSRREADDDTLEGRGARGSDHADRELDGWEQATARARGDNASAKVGDKGEYSDGDFKEAPNDSREAYDQRMEQDLHEAPERFRRDMQRATDRARSEAEGHAEHEWVDRGVVDTKLARVDPKEYSGVWDEQKTHKYSREGIEASVRSLPDVKNRLVDGATPEEMRALQHSRDPRDRQMGRTYEAYYGSDAVKVDFTADGRTYVENGRHRLDSAVRMGQDQLPMRIREQVARRQRSEGA
jgi:hypothetical protein